MVRLVVLASLSVLVSGLIAIASATPRRTEAGVVDPRVLVEDFFDEVEAGDIDGALALVADDITFAEVGGPEGSFAAVGKPAFSFVLEEVVGLNNQSTLTDLSAEGNVVTGVAEFSDDDTAAAGVDRYLQPFTITVNDEGLISRGNFMFDSDDAQTATYLEYQASQGGEDEGVPPGSVSVTLSAQPGGNQPGLAVIFEDQGVTFVGLFVEPGPSGVLQPAHFHTGTCAAPGPIVEPLASVLDGASFTLLSAGQAELVDQGLIINVHKSEAEATAYVSCGEVVSAPAPAPTAPPSAPTAAPSTGVIAPDTGGGPAAGADSNAVLVMIAALLALASGVTFCVSVLVGRRAARGRTIRQ
jgi:hypothetical protein